MRILYAAIDQTVPGTVGGSVHVTAVAEGLAARGHEVHVLVSPGASGFPSGPVHWIAMPPPLGRKELRLARTRAVTRIAQDLRPDAVIERYYNFGGEGILAGKAAGAVTMLEVNAPVVDHPGSRKALLDRALVIRPFQRWRERVCRAADVIVSPDAAILPAGTPARKIKVLEWGADTRRFRPGASGPLPFERPPGVLAVFAGAFRRWHGAIHLVRAIRSLREKKVADLSAVFVGDGPERPAVAAEAAGLERVIFTGAVPHASMPACLAAADIGVAPFDAGAHAPLALGFYWSPLKIFEYMASGLPVVAPSIPRIASLVTHEREGLLYDPADDNGLAAALARLMDPILRRRLGDAARERAEREYGWDAHCEALERALLEAHAARTSLREERR